jgi:hypothetical protein
MSKRLSLLLASLVAVALGQEARTARSFYAEQREETWLPDGVHDEHRLRITRLAGGSYLAQHPNHVPKTRDRHAPGFFFYLWDAEGEFFYLGDDNLKLAWRTPRQGRNSVAPNLMDQYGDCRLLRQPGVAKFDAGKIKAFPVIRLEEDKGNERRVAWVAPALNCFPLRSQILVDGFVRYRVETTHIELLPESQKLDLPRGTRVVPLRDFCAAHQREYGVEFLPAGSCENSQNRTLRP